MPVLVSTSAPNALLTKIKTEITNGKIKTWSFDKDGDFSHVTPDRQWVGKCWLNPSTTQGELRLDYLGGEPSERAVYGGRFIEMLFSHFSSDITKASMDIV